MPPPPPKLPRIFRGNMKGIAAPLLDWYDAHRRRLPWRHEPGEAIDPWAVLVSEIMLQQTTVATIRTRFPLFIQQFPTPAILAATPVEDVLSAWAGLGYYSRARNLHRAAQAIVQDYNGQVPNNEIALRQLPGLGAYTAAAITAIAFNQPAVVVDSNIARIMTRLHAIGDPLPGCMPALIKLAAAETPTERPGCYAQALMDMGSLLCTPSSPQCPHCPLTDKCDAYAQGIAADLPRKKAKQPRPIRKGIALVIFDPLYQYVWLQRRPPKGMLGGMLVFPETSAWLDQAPTSSAPSDYRCVPKPVRHIFSHFETHVTVYYKEEKNPYISGFWNKIDTPLPTVMKKILTAAWQDRHSL